MSEQHRHEGPAVRRSTVVRGLAWSVPAVAVAAAAPAFAASPCTVTYLAPFARTNFTTNASATTGGGTAATGTAVPSVSGPPSIPYTVSTTVTGGLTLGAANLTAAGSTAYRGGGDLVTDGLQIQQGGAEGAAARQSITFTFPQPVTDLSFTIADIDAAGGAYQDAVAISPGAVVDGLGTGVVGAGTAEDPFRSATGLPADSSAAGARAVVTYPGPVTSVTVEVWSLAGTDPLDVFLSDMSFVPQTC